MANAKGSMATGPAAEEQMRRMSRRSFLTGGVAALAGLGGWAWLTTAAREDGVPWPLRRVLGFNQRLAEGYASSQHLAPTFPTESVQNPPRTNGMVGLSGEIDAASWRVRVEHEGRGDKQTLGLADFGGLPRTELITELKCVEGWSQVLRFGGVRFVDYVTRLGLATRSGRAPDPVRGPADLYPYVYLATPDEDYYVGLDIAAALHPQTLLCDTMNGQTLTREHGAPLRLYLAVKYGFKSLKRIGLIRFQDTRPRDYWGERGYDWYAGL
jgi:DMSO/TMAO reductase YedYZ molybdopterin-dependent catalytic subunit